MSMQLLEPPRQTCPVTGTKGKVVRAETLSALLQPEQQHRITEGRYRFCSAQGCDVVYFAEDGSHVFTLADLTVRVGIKESQGHRPICYCFNHSIEEIVTEILRTGQSTVADEIRTRLNADGCDCEHTNPQGSCCLGNVLALVEKVMSRQGKASSPEGKREEHCCRSDGAGS